MNFETENMEFKSQFTEDIYKEIIAFANTNGGIIYCLAKNTPSIVYSQRRDVTIHSR